MYNKIAVEQSSVCIAPTHYDVLAGIDLPIVLDALVCDVLVKKNEIVVGNLKSSTYTHVLRVNRCSPQNSREQFEFLMVKLINSMENVLELKK